MLAKKKVRLMYMHNQNNGRLPFRNGVKEEKARKQAANDAKCQELGWSCIRLAIKTYGNWGKEAQSVISHLASLLAITLQKSMAISIYP